TSLGSGWIAGRARRHGARAPVAAGAFTASIAFGGLRSVVLVRRFPHHAGILPYLTGSRLRRADVDALVLVDGGSRFGAAPTEPFRCRCYSDPQKHDQESEPLSLTET